MTTTGEAGRSKQFPDVYELALLRLEERHRHKFERAWVFEDAVFGLKSSGTAGFKRVGIYDPHGRMEHDEVRANCDIFIDSYVDLDLAACFRLRARRGPWLVRVLVVCGLARGGECAPAAPAGGGVAITVVAVDRGLDALLGAGLGCDVNVGDADTVSDEGRALSMPPKPLRWSVTIPTRTIPIWHWRSIPSAVAGRVPKWLRLVPPAAVPTWPCLC